MRTALFLIWPQAMREDLFKCVCLPDVRCYWPMLLGGHGEEKREYHPTRMRGGPLWKGWCMFVCAIFHGCCRGVYCLSTGVMLCLLSPPLLPSSLLSFPSPPLTFSSSLLYLLPPLPYSSLLPFLSSSLPQEKKFQMLQIITTVYYCSNNSTAALHYCAPSVSRCIL